MLVALLNDWHLHHASSVISQSRERTPNLPKDEAGVQFTWPKYLPENLPEILPEKTSHKKVTLKKSNWTFGKLLGKTFWPCELNPRGAIQLH